MARQLVPERDRVGASLLAAIACNSKPVGPPGDDRRHLEKCIPAKLGLLVMDSPRLLELPALSPLNENRREKVMEKLLSFAGVEV